MAKQSASSNGAGSDAAHDAAAVGQMSMDTFVTGLQQWMDSASELNRQWMSFVGARLRHDAEFVEKLARCDSWNAAAQVQQDWVRQASEAYSAETGKLAEVAARLSTDGVKPWKDSAEKLFEAMSRGPAR